MHTITAMAGELNVALHCIGPKQHATCTPAQCPVVKQATVVCQSWLILTHAAWVVVSQKLNTLQTNAGHHNHYSCASALDEIYARPTGVFLSPEQYSCGAQLLCHGVDCTNLDP